MAISLNASVSAVKMWVRNFKEYGESALDAKPHNSSHTSEFKHQVVKEYLQVWNQ